MKYQYIILGLSMLVLSFSGLKAQNKVAYFDETYVVTQLPDYKAAQDEMKSYQEQIQNAIKEKQTEMQTKYDEMIKMQQEGTLTPALADSKRKELQSLEQQLRTLQQNAQKDMVQKEGELLTPIYEKIQTTIQDVAKSNSYNYVLRAEYISGKVTADNISDQVLKKMGVTPTSQK